MARSPVGRGSRRGDRSRSRSRSRSRGDVRRRRSFGQEDRRSYLPRDYAQYRDDYRPRRYDNDRRHPDRHRDRHRSRELSPPRDYRNDRYSSDYDRPSKRPRRDEDYYSPRTHRHGDRDRRDGDRDRRDGRDGRLSPRDDESSRPSTSGAPAKEPELTEEEKKKARLAKLAAYKNKLKLEGKDKQGNESPASPAPDSPASVVQPTTGTASPAPGEAASPVTQVARGTRFDPKTIAANAQAKLQKEKTAALEKDKKATLGSDVIIPKSANQVLPANDGRLANNSKAGSFRPNGATNTLQRDARITGFGLSKTSDKNDKLNADKGVAPLDEDEGVKRKLEKLPDMPMVNDSGDAALANEDDVQDDADAIHSDEEEAEQVRLAAQRRAEMVQAEQQDVDMEEAPAKAEAVDQDVEMHDDEEEIDPLDAFMNNLEQSAAPAPSRSTAVQDKKKEVQIFDDDDGIDLEAVGDQNDDLIAAAVAKRKKKEIPVVDHKSIQYEPFRKNFYSESVELADMTEEEVEILRAELDNIKCRGVNPPKPILKWSQGGFGAQILDVIREQKYEKPTSIQSQALPAIMSGRDVIGVAKTGSGKTVSFILPMFRHIKDQRPLENLDGPIGLIFAPTRELATQIHRDCKPYVKALGLRAVCAYGGAPIKDQIAELKRGAEIVVCTPGRFIDLLAANSGRVTNLRRVTYVVLDEADRMFDMGFEPQIMKLLNNIRPDRQTVLFSATFPKIMEAVARKVLTKPLEIIVGGRSIVAPEVTQKIEVISEGAKFKRLLELLGELHDKDEDARSLIFVERQESADNMLRDLGRKGYPAASVHGGREQIDRDQSISDFKAGIYPVLIATSVAARGLDVKQLKLVVNYDSPNHLEDYVHRAGRTGRAGNTGTAVTFVTQEQERFAQFLIKALTDSKQEVPEDLLKLKELHDENVKSGQAKKIGSGFGGRGIERLDAARDAERAREKKQYKTGDEPEEDDEDKEKKDKKDSKLDELIAKAAGGVRPHEPKAAESGDIMPTLLSDALNNAMKVQKAATPPPVKPPPGGANSARARAAALAAAISDRHGKPGGGVSNQGQAASNRGPDAGAFYGELQINDFPQKARWSVTNRTNVAKILENTGTSITNKGIHYKDGKEPGPGDPPKLQILVEGDTEAQVKAAMAELTRLLKEGTIAALEAEGKAAPSSRYNVV